jgi:hypothetical protein
VYDLAELMCVRLTGVPFDVLESLATPEVATAARRLLALDEAPVSDVELAAARRVLDERLEAAHEDARRKLWAHALAILPDYVAVQSPSMFEELERKRAGHADRRPADARRKERRLLLYLQRLCAKPETFGRFGPIAWARVDAAPVGVVLRPAPGIARRKATVERWVVRAFIQAMNADPEVPAEVRPRIHPNGRLEGDRFVRHDTGVEIALEPGDAARLARCDGATPAWRLGEPEALRRLADAGVLIWALEPVALDPAPLDTLLADVRGFRDGGPKARWLPALEELAATERRFERETGAAERRRIDESVRATAISHGAKPPGNRGLFQGRHAIYEDCYRDGDLRLGSDVVGGLMADVEPWLDLYRHTFSMAASSSYLRLRELHAGAPRRAGRISLAAFAAHCEAEGFSLRGRDPVKLAEDAFAQVKRDLAAAVAHRADAPVWRLTADECRAGQRAGFPLVDEHASPSADFKLGVADGRPFWVLSELHLMRVMLYHACPDPAALRDALRRYVAGRPWFMPSRPELFNRSAHTTHEENDSVSPATAFVAPERPMPHWRTVPPSETDVVVLDEQHDVRLRVATTGEDLGSLVRTQFLNLGFHQFVPLSTPPHTPRVMLGGVVVQRRTWNIRWSELAVKASPRPSADGVLAVERLRAARDVPRWVFVRPPVAVLRRNVPDKDTKSICIDLESTLGVDLFLRRLARYGELEVVEMLPAPDQLVWREPDGRRVFELRTACPRRS